MPHRNRRVRRSWKKNHVWCAYSRAYVDISHMVLEQMEFEFED
ncbi:MAG: hypothetical protein OXG06_00310 [Gammaproteobacteria bacterium]|nr:hypothetical protein [Gammaproteobacteria bacterium]